MATPPGAGTLKAAVIGAGVFATFHARQYVALEGVALAGVYDPDASRAEALARALGVERFDALDALLQAADLVSVASPADSHAGLARRALAEGLHVYVEKPLATTLAEGEALVRQAADRRRVLACGHQERVVFAAMGLLDAPQTPRRIESVRRGTPNSRNRDVSCVLDLMIHDLDLALSLAGGGWLGVEAEGGFDAVRAEITFRGGMSAGFEASRVAERRERAMRLDYDGGQLDGGQFERGKFEGGRFEGRQVDEGRVEVDFLAPAFRSTAPFPLNPGFADTPAGRDPLAASLAGFLAAVRGRSARPIVTGEEGLAALALAVAVERAAGL